jgi:HK97 family phage portal protein
MANFVSRAFQALRELNPFSALGGSVFASNSVSARLQLPGMDRPAENLIWIYLGMKVRAEKISQVPIRIMDSSDNEVESGDLFDLLRQPNLAQDGVQYLAMIESYLALYEACIIAKISDVEGGRPTQLVPLSPKNCTPMLLEDGPTGITYTVGWRYIDPNSGRMLVLKRSEVIYIGSQNPHNPTEALAPTVPGMRTMKADMAAREQNAAIFLNGGMPDVVFETEQSWTKEQVDEFLQRWNNKYGGLVGKHKAGVLYGGLKAKGIGLNPTELQFLEGLRMSREEQIALMRVKPAMVGVMTGETGLSQGSSTQEQTVAWWNETGLYELKRIFSAHQQSLVLPYEWSAKGSSQVQRDYRLSLEVARRALKTRSGMLQIWYSENDIKELVEHRLAKIATMEKLRGFGYLPNDINDYLSLNLPPHPTNTGVLAIGLQAVTDLGVVPEQQAPAVPREVIAVERSFDALEKAIRAEASNPVPAKFRAIKRQYEAYSKKAEKLLVGRMARYFIEQRGRVLDRLNPSVAIRADEKLASTLNFSELFPKAEENALFVKRVVPVFQEIIRGGWDLVNAEVGAPENSNPFQIEDPRIQQALARRKIQGAKINDTTEEDLRQILETAIQEGDTVTQLGDRFAEYYNANAAGETAARPMTAARTQMNGLVNDGRLASAQKVKGLKKAWLHGGSGEPRESHLNAQGRYLAAPIALNDKFDIGGTPMDAPGDADAPIGETANCGCMTIFVPENQA